jgi:2-methylisocitrate lyase-like PEP mutase family enzyme
MDLSRRDFGKSVVLASLGAAGAAAGASDNAASSVQAPKRMSTTLREMINGPGIFMSPGVYDPLTALTAEKTGFKVLDLAGSALGYVTTMMEPNLGLEDMAEAARGITAVVNIPMIVDAGAGFGEPAHVFHMVRTFESAGLAGIHFEDQSYPKRFHYHVGIEETIPAEAMLDKIWAAKEAKRDPDTVLCGRTDAIKTVGFKEGVRRANAYLEAGVDLMMIFPENMEQVRQIPKEVNGPINFVQSFRPDHPAEIPLKELEDCGGYAPGKGGYKIINYAGYAILTHYKAVRDMFVHLNATGQSGMDRKTYQEVVQDLWKTIDYDLWNRIESKTTLKGKT